MTAQVAICLAHLSRRCWLITGSRQDKAFGADAEPKRESNEEMTVSIYGQRTVHGQSEVSVNPASKYAAASLTQAVLDDRLVPEHASEHRVGVLTAALMRAVTSAYGENHVGLALRAGVEAAVVAQVVGGTCPAWALPYDEFIALAGVVAAVWPSAAFETAAACDLLLSCVLNGDQFMATDVLTEPGSQDLARALLSLAIAGEPDNEIREASDALLPGDLRVLLSERAAALAGSESPDAWVGLEILVECPGWQS